MSSYLNEEVDLAWTAEEGTTLTYALVQHPYEDMSSTESAEPVSMEVEERQAAASWEDLDDLDDLNGFDSSYFSPAITHTHTYTYAFDSSVFDSCNGRGGSGYRSKTSYTHAPAHSYSSGENANSMEAMAPPHAWERLKEEMESENRADRRKTRRGGKKVSFAAELESVRLIGNTRQLEVAQEYWTEVIFNPIEVDETKSGKVRIGFIGGIDRVNSA
eukprot:CAMPEP_0113870850 /NCGR_PEP_ID=MMETSP0780_2-20120614/2311_1 /TAXON_ID=652834 /ORGANISM="Palpitomonas bilix" /LENGTH=216 /DNA_ID=CAMNT_0000856165 /DNA_START=439 /DNA_END=1089 /DNA_ORIENTATION=- /assembly_acc=CAM_ASM_000599